MLSFGGGMRSKCASGAFCSLLACSGHYLRETEDKHEKYLKTLGSEYN